MNSRQKNYFQKVKFTASQILRYIENAQRDLGIACDDQFIEVKFTYCYQALIKIAIAVLAKKGLRVRSIPGHHIKILEKLSEELSDSNISMIGNIMRIKRNKDLYDVGAAITKKEVDDYIVFVSGVIQKAKKMINS